MEELIYKQMIENSKVPFFCGKIIRNELNKSIGVEIIKTNKSFRKLLNIYENKEIANRTILLNFNEEFRLWLDSLYNYKEIKKYVLEQYLNSTNSECIFEVYYNGKDKIYANIISIKKNEKKLSLSMREVPFPIWMKDSNGKYLDVNKAFLNMKKNTYRDIIGKSDYDLLSKERADIYYIEDKNVMSQDMVARHTDVHDYGNKQISYEIIKWPIKEYSTDIIIGTMGCMIETDESIEVIRSIMRSEENYINIVEKFKNKNIERYYIEAKYIKEDDIYSKVYIVKDTTNKNMVEIDIEKMRMDFLTNLSHELRTPINLIISSLQVLGLKIEDLDNEHEEFFRKYTNIIKQNGYRLLKLVNNLLDSKKIDSGQFSYTPQNNDIVSYIEDICISVQDFAKLNNIELIFDTDVEEKIIAFDKDNIERIILNLLSNSIKFNDKNGYILVSVKTNEHGKVKISVKDNGIGIPKGKLRTIFNKFEQVKSKMKNEREGSGIGLSLVKSLVLINGGNVEVKSKLGVGSEFIITLPDILTENEYFIKEDKSVGLKNVYNMEIEFSDIY